MDTLMDALLVVTLLIFFMIVPLLVALIVAYAGTPARQTRAAEPAARAEELVSAEPRFFAKPGSARPKERIGRAVVTQIEDYLARERAAADDFVTSPSVETLSRGSEAFAMRKAVGN